MPLTFLDTNPSPKTNCWLSGEALQQDAWLPTPHPNPNSILLAEYTRKLGGQSLLALADASRAPPIGYLAGLQLLARLLEFQPPVAGPDEA